MRGREEIERRGGKKGGREGNERMGEVSPETGEGRV